MIIFNAGDILKASELNANFAELDKRTSPSLSKNVTYLELKEMRDTSTLTAGQDYRITDYKCTTSQLNTSCAEHLFDIIVKADSSNKLNERARAIEHDGETYFSGCKLESWELKYSLDNNTSRFYWANSSGKGVIYYMKDEWGNECSYDFKNILFKRKVSIDASHHKYYDPTNGSDEFLYTFNAYDYEKGENFDAYKCIGRGQTLSGDCNALYNNIIKPYLYKSGRYNISQSYILNDIVFLNSFSNASNENFICCGNIFDCDCYENTFGNNCSNNKLENHFNNNSLGKYCINNTFKNNCSNNTILNNFSDNIIKTENQYNEIGNGCTKNTFSDNCNHNKFGNYFCNNVVLENVQYLNFTTNYSTSETSKLQHVQILYGCSYNSLTDVPLGINLNCEHQQIIGKDYTEFKLIFD